MIAHESRVGSFTIADDHLITEKCFHIIADDRWQDFQRSRAIIWELDFTTCFNSASIHRLRVVERLLAGPKRTLADSLAASPLDFCVQSSIDSEEKKETAHSLQSIACESAYLCKNWGE